MLAPATSPTLDVDDLTFTVQRSQRRKTLQITVERNGQLILSAPPEVDAAILRSFALEKRFWIYTKPCTAGSRRRNTSVGKGSSTSDGAIG
jgi:predicted metal-dependent hydrolase